MEEYFTNLAFLWNNSPGPISLTFHHHLGFSVLCIFSHLSGITIELQSPGSKAPEPHLASRAWHQWALGSKVPIFDPTSKCWWHASAFTKRQGKFLGNVWVFPKIRGKSPKWMVKIMENPIKMDDLEGKPTIFGNSHLATEILNLNDLRRFWGSGFPKQKPPFGVTNRRVGGRYKLPKSDFARDFAKEQNG